MNNTLYTKKTSLMKNTIKEKLVSIFDEVKKNDKLMSMIPSESKAILDSENFDLDNLSSFDIFNDIVLRNLNILYLFLIQPAYSNINSSMLNNMGDILNIYSLIFIGFFTLFIASVLLFYFLDWRPLQDDLDSTVNFILNKFY